jgi:hypothetical protein
MPVGQSPGESVSLGAGDVLACPKSAIYVQKACPRGDLNPHALYGH